MRGSQLTQRQPMSGPASTKSLPRGAWPSSSSQTSHCQQN